MKTFNTYVTFESGHVTCVRCLEQSRESAEENTRRWIRNNLDDPNMPFTVEEIEVDPAERNPAAEFYGVGRYNGD